VSLNAHWLSVVVETGEDWTRPIVKLFIVHYVYHFYSGIIITMTTTMPTTTPTTTTTYITIDSRKRASGNTCDAVYFLDRTLQGVQSLKLSNMQFYNIIYNINQYNNLIGFISTSSNGTESMYIKSCYSFSGLITISNSSLFSLDFTSPSTMSVVLGFLPQLYPTTTSITMPYALNLECPRRFTYISLR